MCWDWVWDWDNYSRLAWEWGQYMGSLWRHYCISSHKHTTTHTRVSYRVGGGGGDTIVHVCLLYAWHLPLTFSPWHFPPQRTCIKPCAHMQLYTLIHTLTRIHMQTVAKTYRQRVHGSQRYRRPKSRRYNLWCTWTRTHKQVQYTGEQLKSTKVQDSMLCVAFLHSIAISHGRPLMLVKLFDLIVKVR